MASYNGYFWNVPGFAPYGQGCSSTSPGSQEPSQQAEPETEHFNMEVKILNSQNKREFKLFTLRGVSSDVIDSPERLKNELVQQCAIASQPSNTEVDYFHHAKKKGINNRLDVNDMWKLVAKGDKVVLWCVENGECDRATNKRLHEDNEENEPSSKKTSAQKVAENEMELKKKHGTGTYTNFQFKLWAEMYTNGNHNSLDEPPAVAMFNREAKRSHGQSDLIVSVVDKLCTALTPNEKEKYSSSPVKKAELRSTYIRQLNELKMLCDNKILTDEEYMEQRDELVKLMRLLKN